MCDEAFIPKWFKPIDNQALTQCEQTVGRISRYFPKYGH